MEGVRAWIGLRRCECDCCTERGASERERHVESVTERAGRSAKTGNIEAERGRSAKERSRLWAESG
eukprot:2966192-Pleurochrysis_carterae.AAC.1